MRHVLRMTKTCRDTEQHSRASAHQWRQGVEGGNTCHTTYASPKRARTKISLLTPARSAGVWTVEHVRDGQRVEIEGPFFTEEEARISAELMRIEYRGARAYKSTHCSAWNPDVKREIAIRNDAMAARMILAGQLSMEIPQHSAQSPQE